MIEINNLVKAFDGMKALDGLNVKFENGIIGLVGVNGAGKSTLLRIIAGVYRQDEGEVLIDGHPSNSPEAKFDVFFLSDDPYAPKGANINSTLDFYKGLFEFDEEMFHSLIREFGLPYNKPVTSFSKGMRRQMFVALALSSKAHYLLLDEAFDGLDPVVIDAIKGQIIASSEAGKTIVVSSHNIFALQRLSSRFVILSAGKLAKEEATEAMGNEFVKFQIAFAENITEDMLKEAGFAVVSFKKVGSVTHLVIVGDPAQISDIKRHYKTIFIEQVPIEPDEIVMLEMILAKKKGGN